jgi:hypothetical protein
MRRKNENNNKKYANFLFLKHLTTYNKLTYFYGAMVGTAVVLITAKNIITARECKRVGKKLNIMGYGVWKFIY